MVKEWIEIFNEDEEAGKKYFLQFLVDLFADTDVLLLPDEGHAKTLIRLYRKEVSKQCSKTDFLSFH